MYLGARGMMHLEPLLISVFGDGVCSSSRRSSCTHSLLVKKIISKAKKKD